MRTVIVKLLRQRLMALSLLVFTLSAGIVIGTLTTTVVSAARGGQSAAPDATPLVIPPVAKSSNEFSKLAQMMEPSVVFISTDYRPRQVQTRNRRPQAPDEEEGGDETFDLFRRFLPDGLPQPQVPRRREGSGSGFIVDKNGYIMTNFHVVDRADNIKVKLPGDTHEYKAKLIGYDVETDIAVLKIDPTRPLQPVKIANSDSVQVGDWAVAIGAPFGLEASVTAGIVSATGRDINTEQFQRFIQTDAAINPGNSGGPLVNIRGEVIGVNTMIATSTGAYQGIGFALPINIAAKVYNKVIKEGRVTRGSIGITFNKYTRKETLRGLGVDQGVVVESVKEGGPAQRAGLKPVDIIIALNGKPVKDGDDLVSQIADMPAGTQAKLTVDRDGKKMEIPVTIEDREKVFADDPRFARNRPEMEDPATPTESKSAKFGIGIGTLTAEQRKAAEITDQSGVVVTEVLEGSFAEEIGLRERDIIVSINRKPVSSLEDVRQIQSGLKPGSAVAFRVLRPNPVIRRGAQPTYTPLFVGGELPNQ